MYKKSAFTFSSYLSGIKSCWNWHLFRQICLMVAGRHRASPSASLDKSIIQF